MKRAVVAGLITALVLCGLFLLLKPRPATIDLAYKFTKGQVDRYKVSMDASMQMRMPALPGGGGPMDMKISMMVTRKVLDVLPDGSAKVESSYSDVRMSMPGVPSMGSTSAPIEIPPTTTTISRYGVVAAVPAVVPSPLQSPAPGMSFKQFGEMNEAIPLPGKLINVGDSWKYKVPVSIKVGSFEIDSKLVSDNAALGSAKAAMIEQTYNGHFDVAEMMKLKGKGGGGPGAETIEGDMDITGKGTVYFSREKGKMLKDNADIKMTMKVKSSMGSGTSGGSTTMDMTMDMKVSVDKVN